MRIAITGASGLLGRHLIPRLVDREHQIVASKHERGVRADERIAELPLDLANDDSIADFVSRSDAELIVHCAASSDVDGCERDPQMAERLNAVATEVLVDAARRANMCIVYISTDYVFDGTGGPYDEDATPNPINVYGAMKLRGEEAVARAGEQGLIVRAAGFLGVGLPDKPTFAERTAQRILHEPPLRAAVDQRSNITPVEFLADGIVELIEANASGIRHVCPDEVVSRYEFAATLARQLGAPHDAVIGVPYAALKRDAARPLNGGLKTKYPLQTTCPPLEIALASFKDQYLSADTI